MSEQHRASIAELLADNALISTALARGVREAIVKHVQVGQPVATWQDGKVVWVPAEEVLARLSGAPDTHANGLPGGTAESVNQLPSASGSETTPA